MHASKHEAPLLRDRARADRRRARELGVRGAGDIVLVYGRK
jgi:hypothetical protein